MRNVIPLLFFFLSGSCCFAQSNSVIKGRILNKKTGKPIPYSNIGILGKYVGTAADSAGDFNLTLPSGIESDTLQISAIGFKTNRYKLVEFKKQSNQTVYLQPRAYSLKHITVLDKKDVQTKWIGKKIRPLFGGGAFAIAGPGKNIGASYGFKVHWDKSLPLKILYARMYLRKNYNEYPVTLRCRIKSVDPKTGGPGRDLMHENVVAKENRKGWITCNFLKMNLSINTSSFFVVFEWLRDASKENVAPMFSTGLFFHSNAYIRYKALGRWERTSHNLIYSLKVKY